MLKWLITQCAVATPATTVSSFIGRHLESNGPTGITLFCLNSPILTLLSFYTHLSLSAQVSRPLMDESWAPIIFSFLIYSTLYPPFLTYLNTKSLVFAWVSVYTDLCSFSCSFLLFLKKLNINWLESKLLNSFTILLCYYDILKPGIMSRL